MSKLNLEDKFMVDEGENSEKGKGKMIPPITISIYIAPDQMTAYLRVLNPIDGQELTASNVMEEIERNSIVFGIQTREIDRYCSQKNFRQELKVAIGIRPTKGEDGSLTFGFDYEKDKKPKERADGTVDFKELNLIENVDKDQWLCTITPPTPGKAGKSVLGVKVDGKGGAVIYIKNGENTYLSEDKLQVFAACEGGATYQSKIITVEKNFRIKGDVGVNTGNVEFNGSVSISGNVGEGFRVIASKDIEVKGMIEGSSLVAGGNILIKGGINGMRKAMIRAEGDITAKFIQNATVICGGSIYSDVMVNGYIKAGEDIILKGAKASLIGGEYVAGNKILAKTIGTEHNYPLTIRLQPNWYKIEKMEEEQKGDRANLKQFRDEIYGSEEELLREIAKMEEVANRLQMEIETLSKADNIEDAMGQKAALMRRFMGGKLEITAKINSYKRKLNQLNEIGKNNECRIICKGVVYPGVKISIGYALLKVDKLITGQHFYADRDQIIMGSVLPHELEL